MSVDFRANQDALSIQDALSKDDMSQDISVLSASRLRNHCIGINCSIGCVVVRSRSQIAVFLSF